MRLIYMVAADVLRALGWEVKINEKENYWNLVLINTNSSEDMPQSHKSCLRGLLRGWLMEFNYEGGRQQVNIYKELHGLDPEDDRYSCLDTCVKRTDSNTPESELNDKEVFVRRKDRFDRYVLTEPIDEHLTTRLTCGSKYKPDNAPGTVNSRLLDEDTYKALMRLECTREENNFWKEFWEYITDKAIGDKWQIIEAVANNDHNWSEGYVKVEKVINDKQELLLKFTNSKGNKYTAEWQPSDNYACWQTCGMAGDDYSGYLLFPTYKADEYFCIYYNC